MALLINLLTWSIILAPDNYDNPATLTTLALIVLPSVSCRSQQILKGQFL